MKSNSNKLIPVTYLTSYLYCPRKFYLEKIKRLPQPPTKQMIEGRIHHEIRQAFSNNEKDLILTLTKHADIENEFQKLLNELIHLSFAENTKLIRTFSISTSELKSKIIRAMNQDIELRIHAIKQTIQQGFIGPELWFNLKPKYISEHSLSSENLGLKGRVDRVMIEGDTIIPFELKTRGVTKIFPSDEIQITAYAMLLEEHYKKSIPLGILEAGNKTHEIPITEENKIKVLQLIEEIKNITENPPYPSNFAKCQSCPWQIQCESLGQKKPDWKD